MLEDGRVLSGAGKLQFTDVSVDQDTGSVAVRAIFPNPDGVLLPGMFVRARIEEGIEPDALLVPQRASRATEAARPSRWSSARTTRSSCARCVTDRAVGDAWLVTRGHRAPATGRSSKASRR